MGYTKPNILFLDDDPKRTKPFVSCFPWAKTAETAEGIISLIEKEISEGRTIDYLFLDHDLGGDVYVDSDSLNCGMEVVRYLASKDVSERLETIVIHSLNESAARLMSRTLGGAGYIAIRIPFPVLLDHAKKGTFFL